MITGCHFHSFARLRSTGNRCGVQHELHLDGIKGKFDATVRHAINQASVEERCVITVNCFHVTPVFTVPPYIP